MKSGSLIFMVALLLIMAGCSDDDAPTPEPRPVQEPTLTFEERVAYSWGMAENPLQMVIRPVGVVEARVYELLADTLDLPQSSILTDSALREDLGLSDQLSELNESFSQDFSVSIDKWDAENILTVADLVDYVRAQLGKQISTSLFQRTGLYIDIVPVATTGDAVRLLCGSDNGIVSIAWLDGLAYAAATGQDCGEPAMQITMTDMMEPAFVDLAMLEATPETTAEATAEDTPEAVDVTIVPSNTPAPTMVPADDAAATPEMTPIPIPPPIVPDAGEAGVIITNQELGITDMQVVVARTFCRLRYDDYYSWLLPTLVMGKYNINPETDLLEIVEYPNEQALVEAVADGDCAAAGLSQSALNALGDIPGITVVASTVELPHAILVYPVEIGLGVRLKLADELPALAEDPLQNRPLRLLLGQEEIVAVEPGDLDFLDEFLATTGYDFTQLGD